MVTPDSTPRSTPRTPRTESFKEEDQIQTKSMRMISTSEPTLKMDTSVELSSPGTAPGSGSHGKKESSTSGLSKGATSIASLSSNISTTESTHAGSLGEVAEEGLLEEQSSLSDDKFTSENLENILDEFESFDPEERAEIMKNLAVQAQSEQAYEAVEKVAHVAQSSLRRLQLVVKEKDELIDTLQEAVGSAYKAAVVQQERDQKDLEQLHDLFLKQDDRSIEAVKESLEEVIKQQHGSGNRLGGQVAKLFDQCMHKLSSQQEKETGALQEDLNMWRSRYQELESVLEHERQDWHSHLSTKLTNSVLGWERSNQQLAMSEAMVVTLREQLNEKDEQLRVYGECVQTLENLLDEEKTRQTELASDYQKINLETRRSLGKVSTVDQLLRLLKQDISKYQLRGHASDVEVAHLQQKIDHQNGVIYKQAVELAALRKKSAITKRTGCKGCDRLHETEKQLELLRNCVPALVAQVLELKRVLELVAKDKDDPALSCLYDIVSPSDDDDKPSSKDSPRTLVKKSFRLVTCKTIKKLRDHGINARKVEVLQKNVDACKQRMKDTEKELSRSGATVEHLRLELMKAKETTRELNAKLQKRVETVQKKPTDCMKIKGLLENIEMLELENAALKHDIMVEKNREIAELEYQLKRARGFDTRVLWGQQFQYSLEHAENQLEANAQDNVKADLEDTIVSQNSVILELRFEVDQATWRLAQVEKRFDILFGALDCSNKFELDTPISDSTFENIFSKKLLTPALNLVREKVLTCRGYTRIGSRKKDLECLVEALMKVVEKVSNENERLKLVCGDTVQQMEKNKELRKVVDNLHDQIVKDGQSQGRDRSNSAQTLVITDLKLQLSGLANANVGLIRALREAEDQYSNLKQIVHEQSMDDDESITQQNKGRWKRGGRIYLSQEEQREQEQNLKLKTGEISKLEQQLTLKDQVISDLKQQVQKQETELDLVHGKLSIKMVHEGGEDIQQSKNDIWSIAGSTSMRDDNKDYALEDFCDQQYLVEHPYELMQAENERLRTYVKNSQNPEFLNGIQDMKSQYERMSQVISCASISHTVCFKHYFGMGTYYSLEMLTGSQHVIISSILRM